MIGIMGAMSEEIQALADEIQDKKTHTHAGRHFHSGNLWGKPVIVTFSRWGKVASAVTATELISRFNIKELIFTGVAGGISEKLNIGDIVIGSSVCQHDMDTRPLFSQFEIPLTGQTFFETQNQSKLTQAAHTFLSEITDCLSPKTLNQFQIHSPKVITGLIASGDRFISSKEQRDTLLALLPELLCVEMEGGAVAQVCHDYQIPFSLVRTISDSANESAEIDFPLFINQVASQYSLGILKNFLTK